MSDVPNCQTCLANSPQRSFTRFSRQCLENLPSGAQGDPGKGKPMQPSLDGWCQASSRSHSSTWTAFVARNACRTTSSGECSMPSSSGSASKAVRKSFTTRTFSSDTDDPVGVRTGRQPDTPTRQGTLVQRGARSSWLPGGLQLIRSLGRSSCRGGMETGGTRNPVGHRLATASYASISRSPLVRGLRRRARGLYRATVRWLPGRA